MKPRRYMIGVTVGLLLGALPAIGQECDPPEARECVPTVNDCPDADHTTKAVQLGGQGSLSSNDGDCGGMDCDNPGKLDDGTIGQAIYTFDYTRSTGTLLLTVQNTTCTESTLFDIYFNVSRDGSGDPTVSVMSLVDTTSPQNPRDNHDWHLDFDPDGCDNHAPGFGYFDVGISNLDNNPVSEIHSSGGTFGQVTFEIDVTGDADLTACDFVVQGSRKKTGQSCAELEDGEKSTFAAGKFQRGVAGGSGTISPCSGEGPLLVVMKKIEAVPGHRQVALEWETASEIDTVGFQVWRTNLATGQSALLTDRIIPSRGGPVEGAAYRFVDSTAVNGVEYRYFVTDLDFYGAVTTHFPERAVPNPRNPRVTLLAPAYGQILPTRSKGRLVFASEPGESLVVEIGADPTFSGPRMTLAAAPGKGDVAVANFGRKAASKLATMAAHGDGHLYWRVVSQNPEKGSEAPVDAPSATYRVAFE